MSQSHPFRAPSWMRWCAATAAIGIVSCQNTGTENVDQAQAARVSFKVDKPCHEPDSASFRSKAAFGAAELYLKPDNKTFVASFDLPAAPGGDTVYVSNWRYGLLMHVLPATGSGDLSVDTFRVVREKLALRILQAHDSLRGTDSVFFAPSRQGVRRAYARLLVEGDSALAGYPAARPTGLDTVAMLDDICVALARRKMSFASSYRPAFLGGDSATWRKRVLDRIASRLLTTGDSAALFPPAPVRVETEIVVKNALVAGGDESAIQGVFGWYPGMVALDAVVLNGKDTVREAFDVALLQPRNPNDTTWNLEGRATIRARAATLSGEYELRVVARDAKGNTATSKAAFKVVKPASELPRLIRLEPTGGDTVKLPFATTSVRVAFTVAKREIVKAETFTIGGAKAVRENDSVWSAVVSVPPNGVPTIVAVRVLNQDDLPGTDYLFVVRAKDTIAPRIDPSAATVGQELSFDSSSILLAWSVTDNHKLDSVVIGGAAAMEVDGNWTRRVPLAVGENVVRIEAKDSTGNRSSKEVKIVRKPDTQAPKLVSMQSAQDLEVVGETDVQVLLAWSVSDNHQVRKVLIGGEPAVRSVAGDIWSRYVVAKDGDTKVLVEAWDSTGNRAVDSVAIHKIANPDRPVVHTAPGTQSRTVPFETRRIELAWIVLNPKCLKGVTISGKSVAAVDGRFALEVELPVGDTVVALQAVDTLGNATVNAVKITRGRDTLFPEIVPGPLSLERVGEIVRVTASWVVVDNDKLASVTIEQADATRVGNVYGRTFDLQPGQTHVHVRAQDVSGNVALDSVAVELGKDTLKPVIVDGVGTKVGSVAQSVDKLLVSWSVTDDRGVAKVEIAGVEVAGVGTAYGRTVPLALGANTIGIVAWDGAGNKESKTIEIVRLDQSGPSILEMQGVPTAPVAQSTESVTISFKLEDETGIGLVTVGGIVVEPKDGLYTATVPLKLGANSIAVVAADKDGTATTRTLVVERKDESAPVVAGQNPSTASVPDEQSTYALAWTVSDNSGAFTATVDGKETSCVAGTCSKTVDLAYGENVFVFAAKDASGNATSTSATIVRLDQKPPVIAMVAPASALDPVVVSDAAPAASLKWTISDNVGVAACEANGAAVAATDGVYSLSVDMAGKFGDSLVKFVARDAKGNVSDTTRIVVRHGDAAKPGIALLDPTKDTTVVDAATYLVKWSASDNAGLASLSVNGTGVTISGTGSYSQSMGLSYGLNTIAIVAKDAAGNDSTRILKITRVDGIKPKIVLLAPSKDTTIKDAAKFVVKWSASDNYGLKNLTINTGVVAIVGAGSYSQSVDLSYGLNTITIVATDTAGNDSTKILKITRVDATKPGVALVSPLTDIVVTSAVLDTTVSVTVSDDVGLASVTVNGTKTLRTTNGAFSTKVDLSKMFGDTVIKVVAADKAGNVSDTLRIKVRRTDLVAPILTRATGASNRGVDSSVKSTTVSWSATDNDRVQSLAINGVAVVPTAGVYSATVPVRIGWNRVVAVAKDYASNETRDTIWIVSCVRPAIAAGGDFGLYLKPSGSIVSWGSISGAPTTDDIVQIAAAGKFGMALGSDGVVRTFGSSYGTPPSDLAKVRYIAGGGDNAAIAIKDDSTVVVWGEAGDVSSVTTVPVGLKAVAVAIGNNFCAAISAKDSQLVVWGTNVPVALTAMATLPKVKAIGLGYRQLIAIQANGGAAVWGGYNSTETPYVAPVASMPGPISAVAAGFFHSIYLTGAGAVDGFGWNIKSMAQPGAQPKTISAISVGYRYSLLLDVDGGISAFGIINGSTIVLPAVQP